VVPTGMILLGRIDVDAVLLLECEANSDVGFARRIGGSTTVDRFVTSGRIIPSHFLIWSPRVLKHVDNG
jgi:hypothetical protein